jgi:DNA-binding NarL/FixJ family response regulator
LRPEGIDVSHAITILSADDHPLMREGIASVLASASDLRLVAQASDGEEAVQLYRKYLPEVTLLDVQMPGRSGIDALIDIRKEFPEARIIMLTMFRGDVQVRRALRAGASGYLLKNMLQDGLQQTIRLVHAGKHYIPPEIAYELTSSTLGEELSEAEVKVLKLVAAGQTNKAVARTLEIPEETVKTRMKSILAKLSANDRTHAVTVAIRRGIIEME